MAQHGSTGGRASVRVTSSVLERNHMAGIVVLGSDLQMEATVVRDGQPHDDGGLGRGIVLQGAEERSHATIARSLVVHNREAGISVDGSDAEIDLTIVRDTQPGLGGEYGGGVLVQDDPFTGQRGWLKLGASLVEGSHRVGVFVGGSDATIEGTVVRSTLPQASDNRFGRGMNVQVNPNKLEMRSNALVRSCVFEDNYDVGVMVTASDARFEATVIRATLPAADGTMGDALSVSAEIAASSATLVASLLETSARAGLSSFGCSAQVERTRFECNPISINGERIGTAEPTFADVGGNECGCAETSEACAVLRAGLEAPAPM
jgi:hypothetical protein